MTNAEIFDNYAASALQAVTLQAISSLSGAIPDEQDKQTEVLAKLALSIAKKAYDLRADYLPDDGV